MQKKKYLFVAVCTVVLMLIFTFAASAADNTHKSGVFTYTVTDGEVTITDCDTSAEGHIVIPETLDGYPVTEIAERAFSDCFKITDITIPTSIKRIGEGAFAGYYESVYVDSIDFWFNIDFGDNPLYMAENFYVDGKLLTDLVVPKGVTALPDGAFHGYKSLASVTLPKSLQVLGEFCFSSCDNLESIYVDSVECWINLFANGVAAGKNMFFYSPLKSKTKLYIGGELLVDLVIPEGVTTIPEQTFSSISSLESITFHKDFVSFGQDAFFYCNNLKEIYVPDLETWFKICNDVKWRIFSGAENIETIYINNEPVVDLVIPEDVDTIAEYAFAYYKKLRSITFTKPIKQFGGNWATGCDSFEAIYVDSFETWNGCEFKNASNNPIRNVDYLYIDGKPVVDLVIPEGTKSISSYAFNGYKALRSVTIPEGIESIGIYVFASSGIESIFVDSLETWLDFCKIIPGIANNNVSWHPMLYAESLYIDGEPVVDLVIPENITEIPGRAFYNVKSIKSLTLHSNIIKIGKGAFSGCADFESVYVPDIDIWFRLSDFKSSINLKKLYVDGELITDYTFPEGVASVPASAFENYVGLESVTLPSSIKSIGDNAFSGCVNVAGITIPSALESIGEKAFSGCVRFTEVSFPATIKSIGKDAFSGCTEIENVYASSVESWLGIDFGSIEANPVMGKTKLYIDGELLEVLRVPEGVSEIKQYAFHRYPGIKRVEISGKPLTIAYRAFNKNCNNMEIHAETLEAWLNVKPAHSVYKCNPMGYGATLYIGGKQPEEIVIPESVKQISCYAFQNCKTLKKVTIPATTTIGWNAFDGSGLEEAVIGSLTEKIEPVAVIGSTAFEGCSKLKKITFGYGVEKIGYKAFCEFSNLKEVVFYSGLEEIGERAFEKTAITSVTIPSTVKLIDVRAFADCKSLVGLTLGDTVGYKGKMDINSYAFSNCIKLEKVTINTAGGKMGEKVFRNAQSFKDLYINDLVSYLAMVIPLNENESNPAYYAENIYLNGERPKNIVIPEGVTRICDLAFHGCKTLETVKFPSTLVRIGERAFAGCTNLKDFILPESVKDIGSAAFMSCKSITTVVLSANLVNLDMDAFSYCSNLKTVYVHAEKVYINESAFDECENIEIVLYTGTEKMWNDILRQSKNTTGLETVAVYYGYHPESMNPPARITASAVGADSITLTWSKVNGVTGYRVYVKNGNSWKTLKTLKSNTCKLTKLDSSTRYTFAVKTYISQGAFVIWAPEYAVVEAVTKTAKPSKVTASQSTSTITLNWSKAEDVDGYRVYQYDSKTKQYKKVKTLTDTSCKISKLKAGTTYKFRIKAYKNAYGTTLWSDSVQLNTATKPAKSTKVDAAQTNSTITLEWKKVTGADGYRVYQYNSKTKKYEKLKTLSDTYLKISKLKAGTTYKFKVKAYKKVSGVTIWGDATSAISIATKPATPKITKLTTTKGEASLVWSNVSGESGYQVYYSTKKDGDYKKVASYKAGKNEGSKSKLKSKKTYYFKVRAYKKTDSGTVYSAWSPVKSIKIK